MTKRLLQKRASNKRVYNISLWKIIAASIVLGLLLGFSIGYIYAIHDMAKLILESNVNIIIDGDSIPIKWLRTIVSGL